MTPPDPPSRIPKYRILKALLWGGNHVMRWQLQHGLALVPSPCWKPLAAVPASPVRHA
jgi:hypothetical protein